MQIAGPKRLQTACPAKPKACEASDERRVCGENTSGPERTRDKSA